MYAKGSQECLKNAERLLEDARMLLRNKSFGAAQSLIVTALEEGAKAIVLELTNFNYVGKGVLKDSMHHHRPKQLVLLAMQKGLLFVEKRIDRENEGCVIDRNTIQKLENMLKSDLETLDDKRKMGFYVQVNVSNGVITNSPNNIEGLEVAEFAEKGKLFLKLCNSLCEFFRDFRDNREYRYRNNLRVIQENLENLTLSYDEA